jgi:hypothetical protein
MGERSMRFNLVDLLMAIFFTGLGAALATTVTPDWPDNVQKPLGVLAGICLYLAVVYPIYRTLGLLPMVFPRCPCCHKRADVYELGGRWPRILWHCTLCGGDFLVWHNGKPEEPEAEEKPVLALRWPYAFGRYVQASKNDETSP